MHYSLVNLILLVDKFSGFSQNSFEKQQVAACNSSKELCANPRNVSTNKKRAIARQKRFVNSKAFGVVNG
jgi:hypothetical protein